MTSRMLRQEVPARRPPRPSRVYRDPDRRPSCVTEADVVVTRVLWKRTASKSAVVLVLTITVRRRQFGAFYAPPDE